MTVARKFDTDTHLRARTLEGVVQSFEKTRKEIMLNGKIEPKTLPKFVKRYLSWFYAVPANSVRDALWYGDPWFFIAWRGRLAQIDLAMIDAGRNVGDRWALARGQHMLLLLEEIARRRLSALGGTPPNGNTQVNVEVPSSTRQIG